jgi:flagellar assembly protein FliH
MEARLLDERRAITAEALRIALGAARRLAGGLLEREPPEEIERLFARCLEEVRDAPRLTVHLSPAVEPQLAPKLAKIAEERGYEGRLSVKADPAVPDTDVAIDWGKGGAARTQEEIDAEIEKAVADYLASDEAEQPDLFDFTGPDGR